MAAFPIKTSSTPSHISLDGQVASPLDYTTFLLSRFPQHLLGSDITSNHMSQGPSICSSMPSMPLQDVRAVVMEFLPSESAPGLGLRLMCVPSGIA